MMLQSLAYYHYLNTRPEEHPHLTCVHWIWNNNAMVFVLVVVAAEVELDDYCEPRQLVIACKNNYACT
jgi:hypothetical protein